MPLEKQIQIYSVDTGSFYSNNEANLHWLNHKLRSQRRKLVEESKVIESEFEKVDVPKDEICKLGDDALDELGMKHRAERYADLKEWIHIKNLKIKESKDKLLKLLENKVEANIKSNGTHHIRELREDAVTDKNIISVFDSYFTRTIGAEPDKLSEDFMVVQVYYFDVIKDLIYHGFTYKGEKYIYFTSSAGQIRTKKTVFVKESVWKKYEKSIMCGLTIDDINAKGGNNPNKHLAYLALANSATDVWEEFDIDKTIVIDDFETDVMGTYDLVDDADYSIKRIEGGLVPITHTDGAGMMLPYMGTNRMVRLPWVKGLLGVFDFVEFINFHKCSPIIKDIYGKEHNVITEDIQIIFTKSQFKMWKYYDSWDHYKEMYKEYGCTAGITNIEEDRVRNASINYQMLQSLTDVSDKEIEAIAKRSVNKLETLCSSVDDIKAAFGVTPYNIDQTAFQKSICMYPDLINDEYVKSRLRAIKDSMVNKFRAGKLGIHGKYTFLLPDFYAACEHWFMGIENPTGLLDDGEVYCNLFIKNNKLDCLRSPHLYMEHAIRKNKACRDIEESERNWLEKWYCTKAIYTSCHDLISKILQFDVDGDKSLVVADKTLISIAERNLKKFDIVPLYYNMRKAESIYLDNASIYKGLNAAFSGIPIGIFSNHISKIWNNDIFTVNENELTSEQLEKLAKLTEFTKEQLEEFTEEELREIIEKERLHAIKVIKLLCMENNFSIDNAKTLYTPERPEDIHEQVSKYTKGGLPHFFKYAKDKTDSQVVLANKSLVNKLENIVPNPRINCRKLGLNDIDYTLLMTNPNIECRFEMSQNGKLLKEETDKIIVRYHELNRIYHAPIDKLLNSDRSLAGDILTKSQLKQDIMYKGISNHIKQELSKYGRSDIEVADILIKYLYGTKSKNKMALWLCYGDIILENLEKIFKPQTKAIQCIDCGEWFNVSIFDSATKRCDECQREHRQEDDRLRKQEQSKFGETKIITCCDCNKEFEVGIKDTRTERCEDCTKEYKRKRDRERKRRQRESKIMSHDQIPQTL